jgi:hypothetical protein
MEVGWDGMHSQQYYSFLLGEDNLQVYERGELLYSSNKEKLVPWLEFIGMFSPYVRGTVVFDKIIGNAAALLAVKAGCRRVYSPVGSQLAGSTLEKYHIKYQFIQTVPYIRSNQNDDICPLEKLSLDKGPDEFYESVREQLMEKVSGA